MLIINFLLTYFIITNLFVALPAMLGISILAILAILTTIYLLLELKLFILGPLLIKFAILITFPLGPNELEFL